MAHPARTNDGRHSPMFKFCDKYMNSLSKRRRLLEMELIPRLGENFVHHHCRHYKEANKEISNVQTEDVKC